MEEFKVPHLIFAPSTCFFSCHTCACLEACALSVIGTVPKFNTKIVETEVSSIPLKYMTTHLPGMEETLQQKIGDVKLVSLTKSTLLSGIMATFCFLFNFFYSKMILYSVTSKFNTSCLWYISSFFTEPNLALIQPRLYLLQNMTLSWKDAEEYCIQSNGHLAKLDDPSNIPEIGYQSLENPWVPGY